MPIGRLPVFLGGLSGAAGVSLSAAAAHIGGAYVGTAATMLLMHAPALLAIGLFPANRTLRIAAYILAAGLLFFCGDLLARDFLSSPLFPFAAPTGGTLLIGGWVIVALAALIPGADSRG